AADHQEADWLREGRRQAYHALERLGVTRMEDVVVPRARVAELLRRVRELAARYDVRCATFGHAGDGNLHPNFVFERDDPRADELTHKLSAELYAIAMELGGSMTGEHGVGVSRAPYLVAQRGVDAVRVMRAIKTALDPLGILNPGKVLPPVA
ncbi:MAG TPA: FAD-linked oxidase C-terminal domain-containing protein, partial [Candidatus Limnocylindrales bacterium]|nr:FAD-linked oxidase C-terminal domain-containing protein [Candidatus Limnocylindrales bacterium]